MNIQKQRLYVLLSMPWKIVLAEKYWITRMGTTTLLYYCQYDIPEMLKEQDEVMLMDDGFEEDEDSPIGVGARFAIYVAACQGREGFEYDHLCLGVKKLLQINSTIPGEVRRHVHNALFATSFRPKRYCNCSRTCNQRRS